MEGTAFTVQGTAQSCPYIKLTKIRGPRRNFYKILVDRKNRKEKSLIQKVERKSWEKKLKEKVEKESWKRKLKKKKLK